MSIAVSNNNIYAGGDFTTIGGNSQSYLALFTDRTLPVELTSFSARQSDNSIKLFWQTATEVNNYGFEVERQVVSSEYGVGKQTPGAWEQIGFVKGSGNSNSPEEYSFTDQPTDKTSFSYRLKQKDNDGKYKYYDAITVSVTSNQKPKLIGNYPNPFNPSTRIKFYVPEKEEVSIKIYDISAKK